MHQSITHASPVKHTSLPVTDPVPALQQMYHLQETLRDLNNTLQHRNTEINNLKQQLRDARSSPQQPLDNSSTVPLISSNVLPPSPSNSHTSVFVPTRATVKPQPIQPSTNAFTSMVPFPFTIPLTNSLPKFSGKDGEMPTKFVTEFEFSATSLFGSNDEYLLRTIQQCLFDNALTWYIQVKQEQFIDRCA